MTGNNYPGRGATIVTMIGPPLADCVREARATIAAPEADPVHVSEAKDFMSWGTVREYLAYMEDPT